jgi:4-amino-4-deoxychorismate lyase
VNTWINGRSGESLSHRDRGLQYGDGLFETMRVRKTQVRFLDLHLQRLYAGCRRLSIAAPDRKALRNELQRIASSRREGVLKLILTRGAAPGADAGSGRRPGYRPSGDERCTRIATLHALSAAGPRGRDTQAPARVRLCRTPISVNTALAGLKSLNRLDSVLARSEWHDERIWEGLMGDTDGRWVCGTMSNLFLRHGSVLTTPPVDRSGVAGVMRRWVLQSAGEVQLQARERAVRWQDLQAADEIFMTNAVIGIRSVGRIDGGAKTVKLQQFDASESLRTLLELA